MGQTITVGTTTLFTSGYGPDQLREIVDRVVDQKLADAEGAYRDGNRVGLQLAVELLEEQRPQRGSWPKWVIDGSISELKRPPDETKKLGRHAKASTKINDDICDCIRATFIECYLLRNGLVTLQHIFADAKTCLGLKDFRKALRTAAKAASEQLGGDATGTPPAMYAAYVRFCERKKETPSRYYPFLEWSAQQVLDAMMDSPPPRLK
jgi:hypothetical protein